MLGENGTERNRGGKKSIKATHLVILTVNGKINFIQKYVVMKKHKMLVEFIAQEATEDWAIDALRSINFMKSIGAIAEKYDFEALLKAYPKDVAGYEPTGKTYQLRTLEDIAELTPEQFEMFIDDLRNWCDVQRWLGIISQLGAKIEQEPWMQWIDSGEHEAKITAKIQTTNKI